MSWKANSLLLLLLLSSSFLSLLLLLQAQDFKPVGEKVLAAFHDWLESGAGGAFNWSLAEVNHEGWRVSLSMSALCLLSLAFCSCLSACCLMLPVALCYT